MDKREANCSTEENVTSPKTTETVYVIERDVDMDAFTQREKEYVQCQLLVKILVIL